MLIENRSYTDDQTGEYFPAKPRLIDPFPEKGYLFKAKSHGRKTFEDIKLSDIVGTGEDFRRVHLLAEYLYKDTNMLMIRESKRKVRIADEEDISSIISLNVRRTKEFIKRMTDKHVMAKRVDTVGDTVMVKYLYNPLFFNTSKYLPVDIYFTFQESLDKYLPQWAIRKFHEIGNRLYKEGDDK